MNTNKINQTHKETERLKQLAEYNIMDSLTEKEYDEITYLASVICDTPVALITFLDKDRQWFKSKYGVERSETPRDIAFCEHAIGGSDPLIIEDFRKDTRFMNNPLVTGDPHAVFYAGVPLVNEEGYGLGTVCVLDTKPRQLSEAQLQALKVLAQQTMDLLKARKNNRELNLINSSLKSTNKQLSKERQEVDVSLEKIMADHILEIQAQNEKLEKMNRDLQTYTYVSSHHLQEPLRKIQTFVSLIRDRELLSLTEKGDAYLGKIEKSAIKLRSLISNMISYSNIDYNLENKELVLLSEVLNEVKEELSIPFKEMNASLKLLSDGRITVYPRLFYKIMYHLLSNALQYSRKETPTEIMISLSSGTGNLFEDAELVPDRKYYQITVTDNGMGIKPRFQQKIFGLFEQLSPNALTSNNGLGLALVKRMVDKHEGLIQVESIPDKETTFTIYLAE